MRLGRQSPLTGRDRCSGGGECGGDEAAVERCRGRSLALRPPSRPRDPARSAMQCLEWKPTVPKQRDQAEALKPPIGQRMALPTQSSRRRDQT